MESNKDEALRCLRLAEKYLSLGEREKAEKFGRKAHKLFPSQEAEGKPNRKSRQNAKFTLKPFNDLCDFTNFYWNSVVTLLIGNSVYFR